MRKVRLSLNRSGWVEALIDGLNERRPWVAPGRPACQRATRALRCATALRDTARPSAQTAVMGLAARPGRGVPAVHTFAPSGQLASGRWLAYAVSFGGSGCKRRGLPGLIGVFPTTNEEESPLRPTTILRRLLGVTQLNVENAHVAADGPLGVWVRPSWRRSRCGACGRRAPRYDRRPRRQWLHVPWGRTPVWLQYAPWRVSCRQCGWSGCRGRWGTARSRRRWKS